MSTEVVLRRVAFGCALFLLFGPVADRTTCVDGRSTTTDAAAYNFAALFSGIVAIAGLVGALPTRPRVVLPLLGAAVAIAAFGLTAYVAGIYWLARLQGEVYFYGTGSVLEGNWCKVDPASGPPFFATAALAGATATFALAVIGLRQSKGT